MSCDNLGGAGSLREVGKWRTINPDQPPERESPDLSLKMKWDVKLLQRNNVVPPSPCPGCTCLHPLLCCCLDCRKEGCPDRRWRCGKKLKLIKKIFWQRRRRRTTRWIAESYCTFLGTLNWGATNVEVCRTGWGLCGQAEGGKRQCARPDWQCWRPDWQILHGGQSLCSLLSLSKPFEEIIWPFLIAATVIFLWLMRFV